MELIPVKVTQVVHFSALKGTTSLFCAELSAGETAVLDQEHQEFMLECQITSTGSHQKLIRKLLKRRQQQRLRPPLQARRLLRQPSSLKVSWLTVSTYLRAIKQVIVYKILLTCRKVKCTAMNIGAIGSSGENEQAKSRNSSVPKSEGLKTGPGEKMNLQIAMSDFHSRMQRWTGRAGPLLNEPLVSSERWNAVLTSFSCVYLYPSVARSTIWKLI